MYNSIYKSTQNWQFPIIAVGQSDNSGQSCCNCPCATTPSPSPSPPAVVGNDHHDYYCESGDVDGFDNSINYLSDPLWDAELGKLLYESNILHITSYFYQEVIYQDSR